MAGTLAEVARADLVLHLVDACAPGPAAYLPPEVRTRLRPEVPVLTVFNKIDLTDADAAERGDAVYLSAKTGVGLDLLRARLLKIAGWQHASDGEGSFLARERQLDALRRAQTHLLQADAHVQRALALGDAQLELLAEDLRLAGRCLGEITGEVSADDLLGHIFSRFCIGK
jgi:tRNA modification GTPase